MKPISFVIITYNRPDDALGLVENISALEALDELVEEVVIVNNQSSVSYEALEAFIATHPAVPFKYVMAPENLGVSRGRNYGISLSRAPILLFLDDDALFRNKDALRYVLPIFGFKTSSSLGDNDIMLLPDDTLGLSPDAAIAADTRPVGIAAFKIYYASTGEMQINAFPHKRFGERKHWPNFDTGYFSGAAHAIRRSVFEQVGVYPENFFYGMEEYDLSYRALNAGFSIRYDDRVVILHKESPAGRLTPRDKLRGMWVNKSKVAWKYLPLPYAVTTTILWSLEYIKKSGWHLSGFFKGWGQVASIPGAEKRSPVGQHTLDYLHRVKARLWY